MRKIVLTEYISLDGVFENPSWTMPFWNEEIAKYKLDELFASDALLLGRQTYEGFAAAWPGQSDEQGFANRMNSLPKFVVSTTLEDLAWNNSRLIKIDIFDEITRLKQQAGQNILLYGSANLANGLIQKNMIDEYHFLVYPLVQGSGRHFFQEKVQSSLKLVETKPFSTGVVALTYQPA